MSLSCPAFLAFHHQTDCFGFTKKVDPFATSSSEAVSNALISKERLGCFRIRACDDPSVNCVVELYGKQPFSHVFINSLLASFAGFKEGHEVIMELVEPISCTGVEVAPLSAQDFEIMDRTSTVVEDIFLDQITLVEKGMIFPLWLSPGVHVSFKIVRILPETSSPVFLANSSEVHILPYLSSTGQPDVSKATNQDHLTKVQSIFDGLRSSIPLSATSRVGNTAHPTVTVKLRVLPRSMAEKYKSLTQSSHPSLIHSLKNGAHYSTFDIVSVKRGWDSASPSVYALLIQYPNSDTLEGVGKAVAALLKYRQGHAVCLDSRYAEYGQILCSSVRPQDIHVLSYCDVLVGKELYDSLLSDNNGSHVIKQLKALSSVHPILFSKEGLTYTLSTSDSSIPVKLCPSTLDLSKLAHNESCFATTSKTNFVIKCSPDEESNKSKSDKLELEEPSVENFGFSKTTPCLQLECQGPVLRSLATWVEHQITRADECFSGHALLVGKEGSGKSALVSRLARRLAKSPRCVYSLKIDCTSWKGKAADNIEKALNGDIRRLIARKPSILILDGLDFVHLQNEEEQRQLAIERLFSMLWRVLTTCGLPVIATSRSLHSLHKSLISQGGKRLFGHVVEIPVLSQQERLDVLREFLEPDCDLSAAAKVTENFTLVDLRRLATRIQIEAKIRGSSTLSETDIDQALQHSRPSGYVLEKKKEDRKWSLDEVGGMVVQKQLLTEVLLWPTKYSELYARCGVRLGRGVLLHGASGCGKTLLANAFAAHTSFNIISVKGPELLSKYIGSSEENVRQVFERARASSPCVIVFDELDSLAPRRGSDSTGVTDRVVNQLLTELDGAEGLQGVYVIGCTSRMDMIDPALLRPGRFDHLVECKHPTDKERSSILRVILKQVRHSKDVSPTGISMETENWSGADLQALVTNAQFHAIRNAPKKIRHDEVEITKQDIDAVFEESRPKEQEQKKRTFQAGQRVTLA